MEEDRVIRRVAEGGYINLLGRRFADDRLKGYIGDTVCVEYDPEDLGSVTILEQITTHIICEALEV